MAHRLPRLDVHVTDLFQSVPIGLAYFSERMSSPPGSGMQAEGPR